MFAIIFFNDSYANIVTITFSSLILIELLNVYTQVNTPIVVNNDCAILDKQLQLPDVFDSDGYGSVLLHEHGAAEGVLRHQLHRLDVLFEDWRNNYDHVGAPPLPLLYN
jgi:hypothetical protein